MIVKRDGAAATIRHRSRAVGGHVLQPPSVGSVRDQASEARDPPAGPSAAPTIIDEVAPCCAGARCSFALDGDAARDGDEARLCWLAAAAAAMVVVRVLRRAS